MNSHSEENYLKAIYKLLEKEDVVYTGDIAAKISTRASSVTDMLRKLSRKGLVNYRKYNGVTLTPEGKKIALKIIRKHRLWEMFLVEKFSFGWDEVHEVAEQLEHIESEKLVLQVDKVLNYPKFDPHGDPIPDAKGKISFPQYRQLSQTEEGASVIITGVVDHSDAFLRYLSRIPLSLGDKIRVNTLNSCDGSMQVSVKGKKQIFLSSQMAENILISHKK